VHFKLESHATRTGTRHTIEGLEVLKVEKETRWQGREVWRQYLTASVLTQLLAKRWKIPSDEDSLQDLCTNARDGKGSLVLDKTIKDGNN
jgi:hypothetical protein